MKKRIKIIAIIEVDEIDAENVINDLSAHTGFTYRLISREVEEVK